MKKTFKVLAIILLLILTTACDLSVEEEFKEDNFKITLTDNFYKKDNLNSTYYYESSNLGVTATLDDFEGLSDTGLTENSSLEDYFKAVEESNNETYEMKKGSNGKYLYFDYTATSSGKEFYYITAIYKGKTGFWLVTYFCELKNKEKLTPTMLKYADSVEV